MVTLFNYLLISNIFTGGFVLFTRPFEFYLGYIFIIAFLFLYVIRYRFLYVTHCREINDFTAFLAVLIVLTVSSLVNVYLGKDTIFLMTKQVLGIFLNGAAYYLLIKVNKYEINRLFKVYLNIALIAAIIGIFQEISFLLKFKIGYDYRWLIPKWGVVPATGGMLRVNSIFVEPTHLVISMAPALLVSLVSILKKNYFYLSKIASILIVICFILTFSPLIFIAILISLLIIYSNKKRFSYILIALVLAAFIFICHFFIPEIRMRIDDTIRVTGGLTRATNSHLTVYSYASNGYVALKSFKDSPLFGHGLGSHPVSYDKYINPYTSTTFWQEGYTGVNKNDANSLLLRLFSETGLLGIILVFYFLFKFHVRFKENENFTIINNAVLILFIIQLIRQGHYFYNGLFFFVWLYYFSHKIYKKAN